MGSLIEIRWLEAKMGVVDGAGVSHYYFNATDKTIKYLTFTYVPYNRVGDEVQCTVSGKSEANCELTGPIKPYYEGSVDWKNLWFNPTVAKIELLRVHVQYMDGSEETIDGADIIDMGSEQSVYYEKVTKPKEIERAEREKQEAIKKAERDKQAEIERVEDARKAELMRAYQFFNVFKCLKKAKEDKEMAFHANQGLWLFIMEVIAVICAVAIPGYGTIVFLGLMVLAIFLAIKATGGIKEGKKFEIPLISKIKLIK